MVPGTTVSGEPACLRCSGIPLDLTCRGCGAEAWLARRATCWRCLLNDIVHELLAGPDGVVMPELVPLAEAIVAMPRANSGVTWIRANPKVGQLLRALGSGAVELTHEALDALPRSQTVEYLRGLLVAHDILVPRDRLLATYELWLRDKLEAIGDDEQRRIIERFGRWHHLCRLREHASRAPVEPAPFLSAKQSTTLAIQFVAWLATRGHTLAECTQADIDAWYARGPETRHNVARFLYWCRRSG